MLTGSGGGDKPRSAKPIVGLRGQGAGARHKEALREAPRSEAFPGWRAEEIYLALIEAPLSPRARPALERVARTMGAREGTRPEDDPITRSLNATARAEGVKQGRAEGIAEERALLCRLAGRKFGAHTAGKLADRLAAVGDPERLAVVGEWIIDCATGEELLARLKGKTWRRLACRTR